MEPSRLHAPLMWLYHRLHRGSASGILSVQPLNFSNVHERYSIIDGGHKTLERFYTGLQHKNPLTPNDLYISRTTPLTSKRCILYIYSTNIGPEYFKHALYSPFFLFKMQFVS